MFEHLISKFSSFEWLQEISLNVHLSVTRYKVRVSIVYCVPSVWNAQIIEIKYEIIRHWSTKGNCINTNCDTLTEQKKKSHPLFFDFVKW